MTSSDRTGPLEPTPPQQVSCTVCRRELPEEQALTQEGEDYILWFCGIEYLSVWRREHAPDEDD